MIFLIHKKNIKWIIFLSILLWPAQVSPACSLWEQSVWFFRERGQSHRWNSFPLHSTLFSHTTPSPAPKTEFPSALSAAPQPSCLQTTWASLMSHWSSQTEPHTALWYTSSLPEHRPSPPLSLRGTWSKTHITKRKHINYQQSTVRTAASAQEYVCDHLYTPTWNPAGASY